MDTPNNHPVARIDIPRASSAVFDIVFSTVLVSFVALAISNLVDHESVPLYSIILSVLWLVIVAGGITRGISDERGLRLFIISRLADLSAHQFVEIIPQHGDDLMVRFGFTLLGRDFNYLQIRRAKLVSVGWSSGQATSMAGQDMNDWQVNVWYNHKGAKRWTSDSAYVEEAWHGLGPSGRKDEAAALGGSLVDFFRSAGIELHPMKNECEFTTRKQDEADAESSAE